MKYEYAFTHPTCTKTDLVFLKMNKNWNGNSEYVKYVDFTFPSFLHFTFGYICQKYNFCILKTEKQAQPRWEKIMQK